MVLKEDDADSLQIRKQVSPFKNVTSMSTNIFRRQAITVYPKESQRSGFVLQSRSRSLGLEKDEKTLLPI